MVAGLVGSRFEEASRRLLAFLPVLGVWMLPVGLALLAEDVPAFRSARSKVLDWIERRRPQWLSPPSQPNNPS